MYRPPVAIESAKHPLLTVLQASERLTISERSIWRLISSGELEAIRLGRATRVTAESLEELIARGGSA